jgi:hypothetical protein
MFCVDKGPSTEESPVYNQKLRNLFFASGKVTGPKTEIQRRRNCLIVTIFMNYFVYCNVGNGS